MSDGNIERARLLLQQSRGKDAEEYARLAIQDNADDPAGYLYLSAALLQQERPEQALEPAKQALAFAPDRAIFHYQIAEIKYRLERWKESENAALKALEIDPEDSNTCAILSFLAARKAKWEESLSFAEQGLRADSDHIACTNARANALTKLKRNDQAQDSLDYALRRNPENPYTHYQKGRALLESGNYDQAAQSFCEALRLSPDFQEAKEGLVEALKGKHLIYSLFLKYTFFMARLSSRAQWAIILGGYFGQRILFEVLFDSGHVTLAYLVRFGYMAFVYFTWTASSLFNLLLFLHPLGRHALSDRQKQVAAGVGGAILLALACLTLHFTTKYEATLLSAFAFAALTLPLASLNSIDKTRNSKIALSITGLVAILASLCLALALLGQSDLSSAFALIAILIVAAYTWFGGFLRK